MPRLFFNTPHCEGATSERSGIHYKADKAGFITVNDPGDVKFLKQGGYIEAGAVRTHTGKYWVCETCDWEANLNHCRWCDSENLRKVEA